MANNCANNLKISFSATISRQSRHTLQVFNLSSTTLSLTLKSFSLLSGLKCKFCAQVKVSQTRLKWKYFFDSSFRRRYDWEICHIDASSIEISHTFEMTVGENKKDCNEKRDCTIIVAQVPLSKKSQICLIYPATILSIAAKSGKLPASSNTSA